MTIIGAPQVQGAFQVQDINVLVHTWLTMQRRLAGSFDIIWQLQNIITSDGIW